MLCSQGWVTDSAWRHSRGASVKLDINNTIFLQGSTQGHWRFPSNGVEPGYVYLMTHPGTPSVFYDHLKDPRLAATIHRLIALRLRSGIHCRSKVSVYHE